jgi:hypothetical protein
VLTSRYPERVYFDASMGVHAARKSSRVGGGWRLWVLAKALDTAGIGYVQRDDLHAYALSLGVSPRQWRRWIDEARNNDLVRDWQRKTGEWMLSLPSWAKAAYAIGCSSVGSRKVWMKAADLIGAGWKARVWAAYEASFGGTPVSRERMQKLVNVAASTQRYRDNQAGVQRIANYARLEKASPDMAAGLAEYGYGQHKALFISRDGYLYSRKPDTRLTDLADRGRKGRARKANASLTRLQRQNGLSKMRQAFCDDAKSDLATNQSDYVRMFHYTDRQRKVAERCLRKTAIDHDVYGFSHTAKSGAMVWSRLA